MSLRRSTRWYSATPLVAIMPASPGSETAAVIFDLDGVLLDSESVWEEERRRFVDERHGHWRDDAQRRLMGMSTSEWARYLSADLGVDMPPDVVAAEVIERMKRHYEREMPLFAGASDAVRRLARQWPIGVASSSPRSLLDFVLDRSGFAALFSATVSSDEVGHGKPAPDVYEEAARRLGTQPEKCVAVEDSSNGLRAATAAKMRVIAIPNRRYPPEPSVLSTANAVLAGIDELTVPAIQGLR